MVKESRFLKGNFCFYKGFVDIFYIFTSAWKKNHEMCSDFKFDFMLNFAMCSADLTCVKRSMIRGTNLLFSVEYLFGEVNIA